MVSLIEPTIGSTPGFPDAFCASREGTGLIEFKALDSECHFDLEPSQRLWLLDNLTLYKRVAIVGLCADGFHILPARMIVEKGMPLRHHGCYGPLLRWASSSLPREVHQSALEAWSI